MSISKKSRGTTRKLSENILKLLDRKGWTQEKLAKIVGIDRVTISYYINEHHYPKEKTLKKIADALSVDVEELTGNKILSFDEENIFLSCFRKMREIYPNETLLIISPTTYRGYNLATHKKIVLKVEDVDWKND